MFKVFFIFLLYSSLSFAEFTYGVDSYLSIKGNKIAETAVNPQNQVLKLPTSEAFLDLRPDLKWQNENHKIILRPQWLGYERRFKDEITQTTKVSTKGELDLFDLFIESNWHPVFSSTLGLQVYQWGPAELLSPSNPLYHFNSQQRGLYYKEKGQVLLRGNFLFDKENSLIVILQALSNQEPEWKAGVDEFHEKGLAKYERTWGENNYFGIVSGIEEENRYFVGEYLNYVPAEGYSLYFDMKHAKKPKSYQPIRNAFGSFDMVEVDSRVDWPLLATVGFRFESDFDYRLEYIYNEMGYDQEMMANAIQSIKPFSSLNYLQNIERFIRPGLELLGRQYIYSSVRVAEPFDFSDFNIYGRGFYSLQDSSLQIQAEADYSFKEAWTTYGGSSYSFGSQDAELKLANEWTAFMGLKFSL